ncbi:hypothetical protein [Parablautia intestinalis]|nr:hypothetical protein [Parablautia intestinalis]
MRTFDYIRLADQTWDMDILNRAKNIRGTIQTAAMVLFHMRRLIFAEIT